MRFAAQLALASILGFASQQHCRAGAPIDWIELGAVGNYVESFNPNGRRLLFGQARFYHASDGASWFTGAGLDWETQFKSSSVTVDAAGVSYLLDLPVGERLFQREDYGSGPHASNGKLVSVAPLVLHAAAGSNVAKLTGYARLVENDYANWTGDEFHFFNAPIGSLVPFNISYTLTQGSWNSTTMDAPFSYNLTGTLDFRGAIVPEPTAVILAMIGGALTLRRRRPPP